MEKLQDFHLFIIGGPREMFNAQELKHLKEYVSNGGSLLVMLGEGGESKFNTNINYLLEQFGISVNNDTVIRTVYHKYHHPKEVMVQNGILNKDLVRVGRGLPKRDDNKIKNSYARRYVDTKDDLQSKDDNAGLTFVYPYGSSVNFKAPSFPILSSGPISYPVNRPVAVAHMTKNKKGRIMVMGALRMFDDDYLEKEDNQRIQDAIFKWLLNEDAEFERHTKEEPDVSEHHYVPDITALADRLRSCLQESDDVSTTFNQQLYKFDTDLIPEAVKLYDQLGVKHEPLTLIPPQFETPMPALQAAVFPPTLKELPPPSLDLFDLDEQFASEKSKLAQVTNKLTDDDIESYV